MTRLHTDGFEINSNSAGINGWDLVQGLSFGVNVASTHPRSGVYSAQVKPVSATPIGAWIRQFASSAVAGPFWARFYIYIHSAPPAEASIAYLHSTQITVQSTNAAMAITLDNSRQLRLYQNGTIVGSASSALTLDKWYRIDVNVDWSLSSGFRIVEARIDGTVFASTTTSTFAGTCNFFAIGCNLSNAKTGANGTTGTPEWYFDDVAINDNTGSFENSYPGEGRVATIFPSSAGDNTLWTPSSGANYTVVDENPPNDNTDFVSRPTGVGGTFIDEYNLPTMSSVRLYSGDTIKLVTVHVRAGSDSASANNLRNIFPRIKTKASGTVNKPGTSIKYNVNAGTTGYVTDGVNFPKIGYTIFVDPDTGNPITVTDAESSSGVNSLESAQIGIESELTTANAGVTKATSVYLTVEYTTADKDLTAKGGLVLMVKGILPGAGLTSKGHVALGAKGDFHTKGLFYPAGGESLVFNARGSLTFSAPVVVTDTGFMPWFFS